MAITRCPYCRAIIDEKAPFCTSCGTRLLFPEETEPEEEIPGEKIVHADVPDREYEIPPSDRLDEPDEDAAAESAEPPGPAEDVIRLDTMETESAGDRDEDEIRDAEPVEREAVDEEAADGDVILVEEEDGAPDEGLATMLEDLTSPPADSERKWAPAAPERGRSAARPIPPTSEIVAQVLKSFERAPDSSPLPAPAPAEPVPEKPSAARDLTFDTGDLDRIGGAGTVDVGRDHLDKFFRVLEEKRRETEPEAAPASETGDVLPPWAGGMKASTPTPPPAEEGPAPVRDGSTSGIGLPDEPITRDLATTFSAPRNDDSAPLPTRGEPDEDGLDRQAKTPAELAESFLRRRIRPPDSGVGLPETVAQKPLPFGAAAEDEGPEGFAEIVRAGLERGETDAAFEPPLPKPAIEEEEPPVETGEESVEGPEEEGPAAPPPSRVIVREAEEPAEGPAEDEAVPEPRQPFSLSRFFKARVFDLGFVLAFWFAAAWLAARSLGATLFELLGVASTPLLILYGILLAAYLFLFRFFLGETLGDRVFRESPEPEPRRPG